jgi:hypothetical protein
VSRQALEHVTQIGASCPVNHTPANNVQAELRT